MGACEASDQIAVGAFQGEAGDTAPIIGQNRADLRHTGRAIRVGQGFAPAHLGDTFGEMQRVVIDKAQPLGCAGPAFAVARRPQSQQSGSQ